MRGAQSCELYKKLPTAITRQQLELAHGEEYMRKRYPINQGVARGAGVRMEPLPWRHRFLIIICAVILAAGFFLAARQHFMSMEIGIKNSDMRKQLDDLEAEKRRLLFAREVAYSPDEIKRSALKIGFHEVSSEVPEAGVAEAVSNEPIQTRTDIVKVVSERPISQKSALTAENEKGGTAKYQEPPSAADRQRKPTVGGDKAAITSTAATAGLLKLE